MAFLTFNYRWDILVPVGSRQSIVGIRETLSALKKEDDHV